MTNTTEPDVGRTLQPPAENGSRFGCGCLVALGLGVVLACLLLIALFWRSAWWY